MAYDGDRTIVDLHPPRRMRGGIRGLLTHHDGYGAMHLNKTLLERVRAAQLAREEGEVGERIVTGFSREALLPPWRRWLLHVFDWMVHGS